MSIGQGMYGAGTLTVTADLDSVDGALGRAVDDIVATALDRDLGMAPRTSVPASEAIRTVELASTELWDGTIVAADDGSFQQAADGGLEPLKVPPFVSG